MDLPLWGRLVIEVSLAAAMSYAVTPIAIATARRLAFYDVPTGYKGHGAPTPYLGGAAVVAAFALALLVGSEDARRTLPMLAGVAVLFVVGTIDDRRTVSPWVRVGIEFTLGALLSALGHGWHLGAGRPLDAAVTAVWVVAVVNAFNLFDNMDGAASSMAVVIVSGACALGWIEGDSWAVAGSAALCGACLGFLPHNWSRPARIFLGDGGSMPLGFAVAALVASAMRGAAPSLLGLLAGLLLVGVPALDTCLVIVSRRRRGVSILTGGQDHLTHRTRRRMGTARRVALVLGSGQALVSALVIIATRAGSTTLVYVLLAFIACAATVIVGLEETTAPIATPDPGTTNAPAVATPRHQPAARWSRHAGDLPAVVLGLGAGLSPLFSAYYDVGVWVPLGLALTLAAAVSAIARPPQVTLPVVLALSGVAGLGFWSLISTGWGHAAELATVDANRWLSYAAFLLLSVVVVRSRRGAGVMLAAAGLGVVVVAATVLARLLGGDPAALFISGRLNSPLGYINGEGCVFAMGCWLSLGLAERREAPLAALGAACTVAMACLTLLSQSRGAAIASSVAVVLALAVIPGARRRVLALAIVGAAVAAAAGPVLHVYSTGRAGALASSVAHSAAVAIVAWSVVAGVAWGAAVACAGRLELRAGRAAILVRRSGTALAVALVVIPVLAAVVRAPAIERTLRTQLHAFVHLSDVGSASTTVQTRLLSASGNRYDYWRVAWRVFAAHPLSGVGAGNYAGFYFRDRRTQEAIQNPHSLELQTLSELGGIGALLLAAVVAGIAVGAWRLRALARGSPWARTAMVAALGSLVVWLADTSGDWMHLLPGVAALALLSAVVLCQADVLDGDPGKSVTAGGRIRALVGAAGVAFVLAVGGASLLRSGLVQHYLDTARSELGGHPAAAIRDAGRALRLDAANLDAYYIKAAGQARFDEASAARSTLLAAAREDPESFVTWTLLGDLEIRLRDFPSAKAYYQRAHVLDPNDLSLSSLAADPRTAAIGP